MRSRAIDKPAVWLLAALAAQLPHASPADVERLRLEPLPIFLEGPGSSQHFIVTGITSSGHEADVTASCEVSPHNESTVAAEAGKLVGRSEGTTTITLDCGEASTTAEIRVGAGATRVDVDFTRDVLSVLTTKGCNGSSCHGSSGGQNGFKLSLYGADSKADHERIVERDQGRRVNLTQPAESLLLAKPSFQIAHGGGHLMTAESDEYQTLLRWLDQGARFSSGGTRLESLDLYPRERILTGAGSTQSVTVIGRLSDGTTRDLTDEVRFAVTDEAVISSVEQGRVTAKGRGLTTLTARAFGKVSTSQWIVIEKHQQEQASTPEPNNFPANFIDEHVFAKLQQAAIEPFPASTDRVFVRRVFLDAIGILPTAREVETFIADTRDDKRSRLIDALLDRPEYVDHWMVKLEDWFRNSQYYSQGRTNGAFKRYLREFVRRDLPYDEAVREMLTAVGDTTVRPAGNFWHPAMDFMLKKFEINKAVPTITRLFLGKRLECAECHNHPLENLTQDDFYGVAAFLARTQVKHGYGQYRRTWYNTREGEVVHPVTKQPVAPKFLEGETPEIADGVDRRRVLADWITRDQKLQFGRATVNRVWAEYFGVGIVDPFDDFRSTNAPTHPALLDRLAEHFIDSGFRFKALHRLLLNSKTYQLSSHTPDRPGGEDPLEDRLFARYTPRQLPAEVLLDAIVQVTQVPQTFRNYPVGISSKNLVASIGAPYFLTTFGFPRRDTMEPRAGAPSLSQALHLMNGDRIRDKVETPSNVLSKLFEQALDDGQILETLYLRTYARRPTAAQSERIERYLTSEKTAGRERRRAWEHVLWALLNSKEFQLNQ